MRRRNIFVFALAVVALSLSVQTQAATLYSTDFSGTAGSEWSNTSIAAKNGERYLASSQNGFGNGTVILALSSLTAHSSVTIDFDLYIIQSWDGNGPAGGGADNWGLKVDGVSQIYTNFANYQGGNTQTYPSMLPPVVYNAPRTGQFAANHLGFGTADWGDATYRFSLTVPHTASTLSIAFTSYQTQSPGDEGWGLDNVKVSAAPVPIPGAILLLGSGLLGLGAIRRRFKQ